MPSYGPQELYAMETQGSVQLTTGMEAGCLADQMHAESDGQVQIRYRVVDISHIPDQDVVYNLHPRLYNSRR
jgi:hypothetical protein